MTPDERLAKLGLVLPPSAPAPHDVVPKLPDPVADQGPVRPLLPFLAPSLWLVLGLLILALSGKRAQTRTPLSRRPS